MAELPTSLHVNLDELRAVTRYSAECAESALVIFERDYPNDGRVRAAIDVALTFAKGAPRSNAMRTCAWAAQRAANEARDAGHTAASEAARSALAAAASAFLHPLAKPTQIKHILGAAAHAARAIELSEGGNPAIGASQIALSRDRAHFLVVDVLKRYPPAPSGGGRVGELIRWLDTQLREVSVSRPVATAL